MSTTVPYSFVAGNPARASEVNSNFIALCGVLDSLQTTLDTVSSALTALGGPNGQSWDSVSINAPQMKVNGTNCTYSNAEQVVNYTASAVLASPAENSDHIAVTFKFPHGRDLTEGALIIPFIIFQQAANKTPNFLLQYRWQKQGATKVTDWTSLKCATLTTAYSSGTINQTATVASSSEILTPAGSQLEDLLQIRVIRDYTNVSTLFGGSESAGGTVAVISMGVNFAMNSVGSVTAISKT